MRALAVALAGCALFAATAHASPPPGTFAGCPRGVTTLPPTTRGVESAVLQFVRTSLTKMTARPQDLTGARVRSIFRVTHWLPSGWIKSECGVHLWRSSIGVDVYFPRLDKPHNPVGRCNDCAHLVLLLAHTRAGWTVWGRY